MKQKKVIDDRISELLEKEEGQTAEELKTLRGLSEALGKDICQLNKKKTRIVWPSTTLNQEIRTKEKILEIAAAIGENPNMEKEEKKGITGKSCLLELEYFNFVKDIPAEYLHSGCLGVCKRLVELTFNVGNVKRQRVTKRKLTPASKFNDLMRNIKVVHEFSRRARDLDFSVFKGQEFRNLALFFSQLFTCVLTQEIKRENYGYCSHI